MFHGGHSSCIGRNDKNRSDTNAKPEPIMLLKSPIMLLSNAPNFSPLCPNYAPRCPIMLHYAPEITVT